MTGGPPPGRRPSPGRLDPVVRSLLRGFLSPAVADRIAAALQPVASADRDAAVAAAAELLAERFGVSTDALAAALVRDAGQDVGATAVALGVSAQAVLLAVTADDPLAPARPRREAGAEESPTDVATATEPLPVEMAAGRPTAVTSGRDRRFVAVALGAVAGVAIVATVLALTLRDTPDEVVAPVDEPTTSASPTPGGADGATGDAGTGDPQPTGTDTPTDGPSTDAPTETATPAAPVTVTDLRFVTDVDIETGAAGPSRESATTDEDVRAWLGLEPAPSSGVIVELTFEAPDGTRTVRPTPVPAGIDVVAVRLPEELGRAPGRYVAIAVVRDSDAEPLRVELRLEPPAEG